MKWLVASTVILTTALLVGCGPDLGADRLEVTNNLAQPITIHEPLKYKSFQDLPIPPHATAIYFDRSLMKNGFYDVFGSDQKLIGLVKVNRSPSSQRAGVSEVEANSSTLIIPKKKQ